MMYRYILFFFVICFSENCLAQKRKKNNEIDLIKQLGYCICMERGFQAFGNGSFKDGSIGFIIDKMSYYGLNDKKVFPTLEKDIQNRIAQMISSYSSRDTLYVSPDTRGNNSLSLICLEYYKSQTLDSLVRTFKRDSYYYKGEDWSIPQK